MTNIKNNAAVLIAIFVLFGATEASPVEKKTKLDQIFNQLLTYSELKKRPPSYFDAAIKGKNIKDLTRNLPKDYVFDLRLRGSNTGIYATCEVHIQKNTPNEKGEWVLISIIFKDAICCIKVFGEKHVTLKEAQILKWKLPIAELNYVQFFTDKNRGSRGSRIMDERLDEDKWREHLFK